MGNVVSVNPAWLIGAGLETSTFFAAKVTLPGKELDTMTLLSPQLQSEYEDRIVIPRSDLLTLTRCLVFDVMNFFKEPKSGIILSRQAMNADEFVASCELILSSIDAMESNMKVMEPLIPQFDFDENVPGNGFRSILSVVDSCLLHVLRLAFRIKRDRSSLTFKSTFYSRELDAFSNALQSLEMCIAHTKHLLFELTLGNLFPEGSDQLVTELLNAMECVDQEAFYGRCVGFQFCSSMWRPLQVVSVAMAAFSDGFLSSSQTNVGKLASVVLSTGSYLMNPEKRAKRNIHVTRFADVQFCKAFWALSERPFVQSLATQRSPTVGVNHVMMLSTKESSLYLGGSEGSRVEIRVPQEQPHSLPLRLISHRVRRGMFPNEKPGIFSRFSQTEEESKCLVFHCHGGGFIGQSSKAHEVYLLEWAKELDVPILSVDYSLAPEHPYPRALEEVIFAYAWAINNASELGWTGDRIVMVGDSAGGLLVTAACLKLASMGVVRLPDGLIPIYAPFLVEYTVSASRVLTLMDPLLPIGILLRCLAAYTGNNDSDLLLPPPESSPPTTNPKRTLRRESWPKVPLARSDNTDEYEDLPSPGSGEQKAAYVNLASQTDKIDGAKTLFGFIGRKISPKPQEAVTLSTPEKLTNGTDKPEAKKRPLFTLSPIGMQAESVPNDSGVACGADDEFETPSDEEDERVTFSDALNSTTDTFGPVTGTASTGSDAGVDENDYEYHMIREASDYVAAAVSAGERTFCRDALRTTSLHSQLASDEEQDVHGSSIQPYSEGSCTDVLISTESFEKDFTHFLHHYEQSMFLTPVGSPSELSESLSTAFFARQRSTVKIRQSASFSFGESLTNVASYLKHEAPTLLPSIGPLSKTQEALTTIREEDARLSRFKHMKIPKTPYMSPYYATDEQLRRLPPVHLIGCHLDPLLDDSVMFAKRLRGAGKYVTLDLIDSLPHGFLNFSPVSPECRNASQLCVKRLKTALGC